MSPDPALHTACTPGDAQGLDERERGPADELPTLAASALVTAALRLLRRRRAHPPPAAVLRLLLLALLALEAAALTRPYASGARLALAALHALLGGPQRALAHVTALDIKNVQLDSVAGHLLLPALSAFFTGGSGAAAEAGGKPAAGLPKLLRDVLAFFSDHQRDGGETLEAAYRNGTYTKVCAWGLYWDSHLLGTVNGLFGHNPTR